MSDLEKVKSSEGIDRHPGYDAGLTLLALIYMKLGKEMDPKMVLIKENPSNPGAFLDLAQKLAYESERIAQESEEDDVPLEHADLNHIQQATLAGDKLELHYETAENPEYKKLNKVFKKGDGFYEMILWEPPQEIRERFKKQSEKPAEELGKKDFEGERGDQSEEVAEGLREGSDDLIKAIDVQKKHAAIEEKLAKIKEIPPEKLREYVLDLRRDVITFRFLLNYIAETKNVEMVAVNGEDAHEIYQESEDIKVDLTLENAFLADVEARLSAVVVKDVESEVTDDESYYRNLEKLRDTIKPRDFLKWRYTGKWQQMINLVSNVKSWDQLKEETLVVFDFGANSALQYQVGLGDLMPPKIRQISLNGVVYTRRANQGFYNNGQYLAIWTGTKVKIHFEDPDYESKNKSRYLRKFGGDYWKDESVLDQKVVYGEGTAEEKEREVTRRDVLSVAEDFGVDAYFLEAVLSAVSEDREQGISDDFEFLHIAARYIQNAEARFGRALGSGFYTVDFIVYALDRFSLFNSYSGRNPRAKAVIEKYAKLRGIDLQTDLKYDEPKVEARREAERPRSVKEVEKIVRGGGDYKGEVYRAPVDISRARPEMLKRMRERLEDLYKGLLESGMSPDMAKMGQFYAFKVYSMMIARMGKQYQSKVDIKSFDGHFWAIKNSCVGHTMKVFEGLPFGVLSGRQAGRKFASNFAWGKYKGKHDPYLESLVSDESKLKIVHPNPWDADQVVGQHLMPGETAPAALWNHVFWIYKDFDGTVMICHSGADVRPNRVPVSEVSGDGLPGYRIDGSGKYYIKEKGSKVNELPLGVFLERQKHRYAAPRNRLKFIPLTTLVQDNLSDSLRASGMKEYYQAHRNELETFMSESVS